MNQIKFLPYCIIVIIVIALYGCAAPTVQFQITAPGAYSGKAPASMEIKEFTSNISSYGSVFAREISGLLTKEGFITILSSGAESLMSGHLVIGKFNNDSWSETNKCTKYSNGKEYETTCTTYYYSKKVDFNVQFSVIDKKSGVTLVSDSAISRYDRQFSADNSGKAQSSAPTDEQIINNSIIELAQSVLYKISPHKITVNRELKEGDDNLKMGIKYAQNGRLDQAMEIWDKSTNTQDPKVRAAAYYNIGVIKESEGRYADAFELFSKADKALPGEELYMSSMTRVEKAGEQKQKLDRQIK